MNVNLEKWKEGCQGLSIELSNDEIDHFIGLLTDIREDNDQHFHISTISNTGEPRLGGIEISVKQDREEDNMQFMSLAIEPGRVV